MRDANRRTQSVRRSRRTIEEAILYMRNTTLALRPADSTHETNQLRGDAGGPDGQDPIAWIRIAGERGNSDDDAQRARPGPSSARSARATHTRGDLPCGYRQAGGLRDPAFLLRRPLGSDPRRRVPRH